MLREADGSVAEGRIEEQGEMVGGGHSQEPLTPTLSPEYRGEGVGDATESSPATEPESAATEQPFKFPKIIRVRQRDQDIYDQVRVHGRSQREVAAEFKLTQPRVQQICHRVESWMGLALPPGFPEVVRAERLAATARTHRLRLEWLYQQASLGWKRSLEAQITVKKRVVKGDEVQERTAKTCAGNFRYLDALGKIDLQLVEFEGMNKQGEVDLQAKNRLPNHQLPRDEGPCLAAVKASIQRATAYVKKWEQSRAGEGGQGQGDSGMGTGGDKDRGRQGEGGVNVDGAVWRYGVETENSPPVPVSHCPPVPPPPVPPPPVSCPPDDPLNELTIEQQMAIARHGSTPEERCFTRWVKDGNGPPKEELYDHRGALIATTRRIGGRLLPWLPVILLALSCGVGFVFGPLDSSAANQRGCPKTNLTPSPPASLFAAGPAVGDGSLWRVKTLDNGRTKHAKDSRPLHLADPGEVMSTQNGSAAGNGSGFFFGGWAGLEDRSVTAPKKKPDPGRLRGRVSFPRALGFPWLSDSAARKRNLTPSPLANLFAAGSAVGDGSLWRVKILDNGKTKHAKDSRPLHLAELGEVMSVGNGSGFFFGGRAGLENRSETAPKKKPDPGPICARVKRLIKDLSKGDNVWFPVKANPPRASVRF